MTSDVDTRARRLMEAEKLAAQERAEREQAEAQGARLEAARRKIKEQDAEIAAERARKEAEAGVARLRHEAYELDVELEDEAARFNRLIDARRSVQEKLAVAHRRAGRPLGHGHSIRDLIAPWVAHRFGGFNSITGVPGGHPNGKDRPLHERDPLASNGTDSDG